MLGTGRKKQLDQRHCLTRNGHLVEPGVMPVAYALVELLNIRPTECDLAMEHLIDHRAERPPVGCGEVFVRCVCVEGEGGRDETTLPSDAMTRGQLGRGGSRGLHVNRTAQIPIPRLGNDLGRHVRRCATESPKALARTALLCKAKIAELHLRRAVEQDVRRLHVSVCHIERVQVA